MSPIIRTATDKDLDRITEIYGGSVLTATASFENTPPDIAEMRQRYTALTEKAYPYIVAEFDGQIAGYAYAGPYRSRPAYYWSVETTIYLDPQYQGNGIGKSLLKELIDRCTKAGFRQMIGVIATDDENPNLASIGVHRSCGFEMVGNIKNVGRKHGIWLDTVFMQKGLGEGADTPPKNET